MYTPRYFPLFTPYKTHRESQVLKQKCTVLFRWIIRNFAYIYNRIFAPQIQKVVLLVQRSKLQVFTNNDFRHAPLRIPYFLYYFGAFEGR